MIILYDRAMENDLDTRIDPLKTPCVIEVDVDEINPCSTTLPYLIRENDNKEVRRWLISEENKKLN